jgi:hypothetical protein
MRAQDHLSQTQQLILKIKRILLFLSVAMFMAENYFQLPQFSTEVPMPPITLDLT